MRHEAAADGLRQAILPSGELAESGLSISRSAKGLDMVRYADLSWQVPGPCRGPMAGTVVYAINQIGSRVLIAPPPVA